MPLSKLHVVAFDIPYPPDYGGVIDVYYKLIALQKKGIKISLHCYEYGRQHREELTKICSEVFYYPRKNSKSLLRLLSLFCFSTFLVC